MGQWNLKLENLYQNLRPLKTEMKIFKDSALFIFQVKFLKELTGVNELSQQNLIL